MTVRDTLDNRARLNWLRQRLLSDGEVRATAAMKEFGVSSMTVRRDLLALVASGEAHRVRGGAVVAGPAAFTDRSRLHARAKARIAAKLLELLPTSGAIAVDSSSTMACFARLIASAQDLIVVTNGIEAFDALGGKTGVRPILTGGEREPRTGSLVGPTAARVARSYAYRVCFLSASAVHAKRGATEPCPGEAEIVRAFAESSRKVVLGADATKLGTEDSAVSLSWPEIDLLVTELSPNAHRLDPFRDLVDVL